MTERHEIRLIAIEIRFVRKIEHKTKNRTNPEYNIQEKSVEEKINEIQLRWDGHA